MKLRFAHGFELYPQMVACLPVPKRVPKVLMNGLTPRADQLACQCHADAKILRMILLYA